MEETNFTKAQIKEMLAQRYWIALTDGFSCVKKYSKG